jgi:hypothetical protein
MGNPLSVRFLSQLRGAEFAKHRDERRAQGRAENTIAIELKLISKLYKIAARDWHGWPTQPDCHHDHAGALPKA